MRRADEDGEPAEEVWIVDRVEGDVAVLVLDDDADEIVVSEVALDLLGDRAVEGAFLRVPLGDVGEPVWDRAVRDREAEEARRAEAEAIIDELRERDPGGDVEL